VRLLGTCGLVDVLGEWGSHNTEWRLGRAVTDVLDGVDFALTYYSPLVWRILAAGPIGCFRAEFTIEDLPLVNIADGRPMTEWATAVERDATHSGEYVRAMAAAERPIVGPLVCTCAGEIVSSGDLQLRLPALRGLRRLAPRSGVDPARESGAGIPDRRETYPDPAARAASGPGVASRGASGMAATRCQADD